MISAEPEPKESAMPTHSLDRRVLLETAPNFRDLGGIPVAGGTVRPGALYRSATLAKLAGDDVAAVAGLDVRTVYDLRTAAERDGALDNLPPRPGRSGSTFSPTMPRMPLPPDYS